MPKLDELLQGVALAVATEDPIVARAASDILRRRGAVELEIVPPSIVAARTDHGARFDVVLLDLRAESDAALIANADAKRRSLGVPIVFMISEAQWRSIRTGRDVDPHAFAILPPDEAELTAAILVNLERRKLERRLLETERRFEATLEEMMPFVATGGGERHPVDAPRAPIVLRHDHDLLQILVEDSPAAVAMFDTEMRYLFWSKRWISDYRLADVDLRGKSHYEVFPEIDENWKAVHRRCLAGATESREDDPFLRADGRTDYIRWVVKPWHKAGRDVGGLILLTEVVTDRKLTEQTLRQSERQFRAIFDQTFQFIGLLSTDGTLIKANHTALEFAGIGEAEVHGRPFWKTPWWSHAPELQERVKEAVREAAAGRFVRFEVTHPSIDGRIHTVDFSLKPVHDETGNVTLLIPEGRDITERKIAEDALAASEERYRNMLDCLPFGILVHDGKTLLYANPGALRLLDVAALAEVSSSLPAELLNADSLEAAYVRLDAIIRTGDSPPPIEALVKRRDGVTVDVEVHVTRSRFAGHDCVQFLVKDITARNRLESQLRQSQKMQAIGQLAGGVAHDFNNILTVINGCCELLAPRLSNASADETEALAAIRDAGERATLLTRQLLAFSRKQVLEPRVLDLNEVVADSERMLRRLIGEDITLATIRDPAIAPVRVDRGQIEQVVLNLCLNARDAMPRGGRLAIETATVDLDEATCGNQPDARPGRYVRLTITDTGCGMTDAVKSRIFEPFFTTKEKGKGTGLGLSTVYGIVRQSEGQIAVYSEVGVGSTFMIFLPAVATALPTPSVSEVETAPRRGSETILLVEDEAPVRRVARMALEMHGYAVLEASSGPEAVALVASREAPIHLVVTDLVMPEMSGRELAEALRARHPEILVLFVSGYTEDTVVLHGILEARDHFLSKPFTPFGLARKVRQILDTNVRTVPGTIPTFS